ncbi:MAG: sigma-70 family RNA polymerase sigma factor [Caldilineaceae bacterium]|nr:sigma-70 family RNA polymerase sigma factor [Caldilineaceae bacterium]
MASETTRLQSELSDEVLMARIQARDTEAFSLLYDRYAQTIFSMAAHLLSGGEAEEIVQEIFLRLWRRAGQYDPARGAFRSWFLALARNRIFDQWKRRPWETRAAVLHEFDHLLVSADDPADLVTDALWDNQRQAAMLRALHGLPDAQRRAIVLAYFGGLSHAEIAAHLDWPIGTVKKRIRLGLQKLRSHLAQWHEVG